MTASNNILKKCSTCGIDVAGRKRWKDGAGNYYCDPCWAKRLQEHRRQNESAVNREENSEPPAISDLEQLAVAAESGEESASNMLACAGCGTEMQWHDAHEHAGKPFCFQCIIRFAKDESPPSHAIALASNTTRADSPSYDLVTTRSCPYCGEEIQATAKKCKHCGEWLDRRATAPVMDYRNPMRAQRSAGFAAPPRSYLNSAVVTLILYWLGVYIVGLIANVVYLKSAQRAEQETGIVPEGKGCLVALLWVFVWIPLIVGAVVLMLLMVVDMKQ